MTRDEGRTDGRGIPVEWASERKIRARNTALYRLAHWPIWIWVFFLVPGPLTFDLFANGFDARMGGWLGLVLVGTGVAGLRGRLPGVEPRPYIIRFTEDRRNPLYRRVCYTFAWGAILSFALLNLTGLVWAVASGEWRMRAVYEAGYFPIVGVVWALGAAGWLPRVKASTRGEGHERRFFYGSLWAVCLAQPVLWLLWGVLPLNEAGNLLKLVVFCGLLGLVGLLAYRGKLPRTRPIVPGELAVSD